ncbi:MAG: hypothetical protein G8237_08905 [Magnetococcales bacterium]|nr:hypothetical protein [Magnetococcales bacterium]
MFERILFNQWGRFSKAIVPLTPLTLLMGASATGKTQLLEGVRLLSWLAKGQPLDRLEELVGHTGHHRVRGLIEDLPKAGANRFGLACSGTQADVEFQMGMMLEIQAGGSVRLVYEHLKEIRGTEPRTLYQAAPGSKGRLKVDLDASGQPDSRQRVTLDDRHPLFARCAGLGGVDGAADHRIAKGCAVVQQWLTSVVDLDFDLAAMRAYGSTQAQVLQPDGGNLSGVLYRLWGGERPEGELTHAEQVQRADICAALQILPGLEQAMPGFVLGGRGDVVVRIRESMNDAVPSYDVSRFSDGQLRVLGLMAALLSCPESTLVVMDGIDSMLYPQIAPHLLQHIQTVAQRRHLRVLLVGRDPALLDALPDSALADALLCHRDNSAIASRVVRLGDLSDHPGRLAAGPVGHLLTRGVLERFANIVRVSGVPS